MDLKYSIPITESLGECTDFIIQGIAINETITSNNHKFIAEELKNAAGTLMGVPLLVDHENKVENIKGRVINSSFDETFNRIPFKAKVMDELCKQMIKDGRLNSVSVGAVVKSVEEDGEGHLIPRGLEFKELSLVAVPADSNATFTIALKEAYQSTKTALPTEQKVTEVTDASNDVKVSKEEKQEMIKCENCGKMIKKEEMKKHMEECEESNSNKSTDKLKGGNQMSETTEQVDTKLLLEKIESLGKELAEMKASKVESKAEVKVEEETLPYRIVSDYNSFSLIQNKY
jgi:hypothetical protein